MVSKYIMSLNKQYVVSTFGLTYINKVVEVVGIVNYEEALKLDDVKLTALNEKVIDSNYEEYFADIEFYKCKLLDDSGNIIILWSDIIDGAKTSVLGEKYNYKVSLELDNSPSSSIISKDTLISELIVKAQEFNATLTFTSISGDSNSLVDIYQERLKEAENVLRSLQSLNILVPTLESIERNELQTKVNTILENIDTINERLEIIATGL